MRKLRGLLRAAFARAGVEKPVEAGTLERWRWDALCEEDAAAGGKAASRHSLLPSGPAPLAEARLAGELRRQGLGKSDATAAARAVVDESARLTGVLKRLAHQAASGKPPTPPSLELRFRRHALELSCGKARATLSLASYAKLAILHRRHAASEAAAAPPACTEPEAAEVAAAAAAAAEAEASDLAPAASGGRAALHYRIFALVMRYSSLHDDDEISLGPPVWKVLQRHLGVACEAYASPLNAYLPAYASPFADVDAPFGSRGSFAVIAPVAGSFAAAPPSVPALIAGCIDRVLRLLDTSSAATGGPALSFCVVLRAPDPGALERLTRSHYCKRVVRVASAEHGVVRGGAYAKLRRAHEPPYAPARDDAVVAVLQTEKAARKWPADGAFEEALRAAFGSCLPLQSAGKRLATERRSATDGPAGAADGGGSNKKRRLENE